MKILMIDDEQDSLDRLRAALAPLGHQIQTQTDPVKALESFRADPAAIVILDPYMPGMSSLQAVNRIKELQPKTAVIVCTGNAAHETENQAMDWASAFIQKPVNFETLISAVNTLEKEISAPGLNTELLAGDFFSRVYDLIFDAELRIHALFAGYNETALDTLFQLFQTLHTLAGQLNYTVIDQVAFEAKTLVALMRRSRQHPESSSINLLYAICDGLWIFVEKIESGHISGIDKSMVQSLIILIQETNNNLNGQPDWRLEPAVTESVKNFDQIQHRQHSIAGTMDARSDIHLDNHIRQGMAGVAGN